MSDLNLDQLREVELWPLVETALATWFPESEVVREPRLSPRSRPDFLITRPSGEIIIVEAKGYRFSTSDRLEDAELQLRSYLEEARARGRPLSRITTALVVAGPLSREARAKLSLSGISYTFDGADLRAALGYPRVHSDYRESVDPISLSHTEVLRGRLESIKAGNIGWSEYQATVHEILELLWCPPLEKALYEAANVTGVNRRDMIFPNYASSGFWEYLRRQYSADHIVVDAKNYSSPIRKDSVLQVANYLSAHGTGLFGVIVTRKKLSKSADLTRREQWITYRKMIVVLTDEDILQMLAFYDAGGDPSDQVRQKVEDFRLSF